jgi:hypothetical protein
MKWYDYVVCICLADIIAALVLSGSFFVLVPVLAYQFYSDMRKQQEISKNE